MLHKEGIKLMMMTNLLALAEEEGIEVNEYELPERIRGLYFENSIAINKKIKTEKEKRCVLAEELGHFYFTIGDILDLKIESNRKQEIRARNWAINKLTPFEKVLEAYELGHKTPYEMAEYLDVTEDFMKEAILYYQKKYRKL